MWSGFCECLGGRNCAPCVHKHSIAQHFKTSMFSVLPSMDPNMKAMCHLIATGKTEDGTWYRTAGEEITFNNVRHSLPPQKKKKKKQHSLASDVQSNRSVSNK